MGDHDEGLSVLGRRDACLSKITDNDFGDRPATCAVAVDGPGGLHDLDVEPFVQFVHQGSVRIGNHDQAAPTVEHSNNLVQSTLVGLVEWLRCVLRKSSCAGHGLVGRIKIQEVTC